MAWIARLLILTLSLKCAFSVAYEHPDYKNFVQHDSVHVKKCQIDKQLAKDLQLVSGGLSQLFWNSLHALNETSGSGLGGHCLSDLRSLASGLQMAESASLACKY